ncbi:MARCKS-related protein [Anolis sagrei]|uniref:MARCKS-related protein n=1 Tax=Anolis sagrei TaxID=38937 RepID=UPI003520160C
MGSHSSKAAKGGDLVVQDAAGDASPSKSNGQENGHVKINGDVSPKVDGEATPLNGNRSAELVKEEVKAETASGDSIEPAPVAEGSGEAKADGEAKPAASKETPKKKKFSFKKSFKLSGISFRKAKKQSSETSAVSSPSGEEQQGKAEAKGEKSNLEEEQSKATNEEATMAEMGKVATVPAVEAPEDEPAKQEGGNEEGAVKEEEKPAEVPSTPSESPEEKAAKASLVPAEQKEE